MPVSLLIDTAGGSNFEGNDLRNVGSLHVGGSALADRTLQVTGTAKVSGAVEFLSTLSVVGVATFAEDLVFSATAKTLRANTSDGSDTFDVRLNGGGGTGSTRGAQLLVAGNERVGLPGVAILSAGNVSGAYLDFQTQDLSRLTVNHNGVLLVGTTITDGAGEGDTVIRYGKEHRSVTNSGTTTIPLVSLLTLGVVNDVLQVGSSNSPIALGSPPVVSSVGGDVNMGNNNGLNMGNVAGTSPLTVLFVDTSNRTTLKANGNSLMLLDVVSHATAGALVGYIDVHVNGNNRKMPYYAVS